MVAIVRSVAAISLAITTSATAARSQARVNRNKPNPTTAAAIAAIAKAPVWRPAVAPVAISLAPGDRMIIKGSSKLDQSLQEDPGGVYSVLEYRPSSNMLQTVDLPTKCGHLSIDKTICTYSLGVARPLPSGTVLYALVDLSPNASASELVTQQEIGNLAAPVGNGPQQTALGDGQTLFFSNNQTLVGTSQGWGARYYVLMSGGQQVKKWPAGRLLVVGTRVTLLKSVGFHRTDDWGIPKHTLMALK
jgi:hypothetical protein